MKLLRYGPSGREKPGLLDEDGNIRDLSGIVDDITPDVLSPRSMAKLARLKTAKLPLVKGKKRMGIPVTGSRKFVAIGLNFSDHAKEAKLKEPEEPIIFTKQISCLNGPNDDVTLPKGSKKGDWEVELGIVIGSRAKNIAKRDAVKHVAGYCLINDVSERHFQAERSGQWVKGKSYDTFGPVGPWLVTPDEVGNVQRLAMWTEVNGERMQDGNSKNMIFSAAHIVWYVSMFFTLEPGDLICTGTPHGVGMGMSPQRFLKPGDVMHLGIDKLGTQTQKVVRDKE